MMFHSVSIMIPGPLRETVDHPLMGPLLIAALRVREMVAATGDGEVYDAGEIMIAHVPVKGKGTALQVIASIRAPTIIIASKAVAILFEVAEKSGLQTFLRVAPQAESRTDFCTEETAHKAHVRFIVTDKPGKVELPEEPTEFRYLGFGTYQK